MKKLLIASVVAAAMSTSVQAEDKATDKWVAGFAEYYLTDESESGAPNFLDNGTGIGAEFGFKFAPEWAARLEVSHLNIDASPSDESGNRVGIDALYFLPEDLLYVFGGLKYTKIVDGGSMFNLGLGKHWHVNEDIAVVTEVAAYQGLDDSNDTHVGFKLGLAYTFGESSTSSATTDTDSDGVADGQDNCPGTAYGTSVDAYGCALVADVAPVIADADGDGVADDIDECANTPSTDVVDATGCGVFIEETVSSNIKVLFANNSSVVTNPNDPQFQEFVDFMNRFPSADALIEGHSSAPGAADYNLYLSQKRADAIRTLLVEQYGVDNARLTTKGYGETQLLDTANTAEANKKNRRIIAIVSASERVKLQK
ncbi:OmpA family protein [Paraglaciecola sp. 2405UD69-4]|uniref:OmpA family protein n=1 Tax=Paraglaciecola sp. 2405UD69-4 TaxID=3391836 RepID=UPI0039C91C3C